MEHRTATAKRVIIILLVCIAVLFIVAFVFYFFGQKNNTIERPYRDTVTYNGEEYIKKDTVNFLIMGIDTDAKIKKDNSNPGTADFLILLSVDRDTNSYRILHINRNIITDIKTFDARGNYVSTEQQALSSAHACFDGMDKSCKNTVDAVSDFLCKIRIDYYVSMNMPAIQILTDHLGGVPVTFDHDYTFIDQAYQKGTTLSMNGEQAIGFLRATATSADNADYVDCQKLYFDAFLAALAGKSVKDIEFLTTAFTKITDYILMDCSITTLGRFLGYLSAYTCQKTETIKGITIATDHPDRFYVDYNKRQALVFEWFYVKAE